MPTQKNTPLTAVGWMLASSATFSVMGAIIKHIHRLPTWEIVFFRSFVNFLLLLPWVLKHLNEFRGWQKGWKTLLVRGVSGCISMALYFYAIEHIHLADAVMLNYISPIGVLILSSLILGERLKSVSIAFIIVAFGGVVLILKPGLRFGSPDEALAAWAGFASAFVAAVAYISIKLATRSLSPRFIVFTFATVASVISFIPAMVSFVSPTPEEWFLLFICGSFAAFAQNAMTKGYAGLPASTASPLMLCSVLFSGIMGWIFWAEVPDQWSVLGFLLIAIGLTGAYRTRVEV